MIVVYQHPRYGLQAVVDGCVLLSGYPDRAALQQQAEAVEDLIKNPPPVRPPHISAERQICEREQIFLKKGGTYEH